MTNEQETSQKKKRMPTSVYVGSGLIGIAVLGFLFWCAAFLRTNALIEEGLGNPVNFILILSLYPIFFVGLPLYFGIRLLRRGKQNQEDTEA